MPSLVKWVGSKRGLLATHADKFPKPTTRTAHVPFVGAGPVAAHYREQGYEVIASDINPRLINAHVQVRDRCDVVISELEKLAANRVFEIDQASRAEEQTAARVYFESERDKLNANVGATALDAARFLFVVRAGFNGLYRENSRGKCNTPYGKAKLGTDIVQAAKLREYSAAIQGVVFYCEDFAETLARAFAGDAVYLDPPYEGTFTKYVGTRSNWDVVASLPGTGMLSERERLVATLHSLDARGVQWTLSDAPTPATRAIYSPWSIEDVTRSGCVNSNGADRGRVTELLVRNWS